MKNETLHIRLKANMQKSLTNFKTWLVLSVFVLLGAMVPQEAKANYDSRGLWYFDNTNTKWTNVYLIVGRGDWTQAVKMVLQYDNIYKAESTWDNTYAFFFADSACGYSTGSGSDKDIVGSRTGNYTSNFTSKPSNNIFSPSGNGTNITGTWSTAYHLKHPWGTGNDNDWSWKVLKYNDGVYTLNALYASGKGCNYSKPNSTDEAGYVSNPTLVGSPTTGDECIFTFNPSNNAITITKVVQCNEITDVSSNFSLSETTYDYNGEPKKPTVSSTLNGIGDITTKYYNSEGNVVSEPTNAGTYTVKITVSQSTTYCALTTETVVGTYTINKIDQSAITIANTKTTFCGFPANNQVTLNIDGGNGDGDVVYTSEDEDIATISGNILTVKAEGTVTISAQKQAGTNHNASNTATKSFTFYKAPDAPTVSVTNLIKCGDNTSEGLITLKNYNQGYSYSISPNDEVGGDAQNGYQISIADNYTITVTRKVNETCSLSTPSATIPVVLTDNTPAATVSIADVAPICEGGSATLTCNVTPTKGTVKSYTWTLPNESTQVTNTNTLSTGVIAEAGTYTYSVVVTLENNDCTKDLLPVSKSVTVKEAPTAPDFGGNNSQTVCQNTNVTLPEEFDDVQLKWYEYQNRISPITSFTANAAKTVYAAAYNGTCESAELTTYTYNIYPVPNITVAPRTQSAMCYELVTVTATVTNRANGALVYWYEGNTQVGTGDEYTFTKTTTTTVSNLRAEIRNSVNCDPVSATVPAIKFTAHQNCGPSYVQGKILYLVPGNAFGNNERWTDAGAWFAAAFLKTVSGTTYSYWVTMLDEDGDGTFACEIPTGYNKVVICRMNPSNNAVMFTDVPNNGHANWNDSNKWNETGEITVPTTSKKITITGWDKSYTNTDLESGKTFKTIVLNTNGVWNKDGATFKAHPWVDGGSEGNWPRMIKGINDGIYLVDVYTTYNRILFERLDGSGNTRWNVTSDLVLDIYGNEFKILEAEGHGEWHWRWFESDYDLGVQTNVVEQNGKNLEIHCTGVVYKTSCAPGIKYGFEYATNQNMTGATYVEYAQGAITPGASFEKYITVEPGEYYVRAKAQYENSDAVYGWVKKVIIANNCDSNYEFTVGSTSAIVQACGGNRQLPAIEILTNKNVGGGTIAWVYEWKNADGSAATNLSATNIPQPTFNGTTSQEYKVTIYKKVNNDIKCVQTAEYQVAYEDNSPKATIVAKEEVAINETLVLQGSINYSESFTWLVKEGNTDVTAQKLSDVSVLNPTFNTQETGTYTVTLTAEANENCEAHQTSITIEVLPPTENCSSSELEIGFSGSHNCFETSGGVNLLIKTDNSCIEVAKISSGNTYTLTKEYLQENNLNYPIKIFFGALNGNHCNTSNELKGYTDFQEVKESDLGNKVIYSFPTGVQYQETSDVCGYGRKYTNIQKSSTASTKASAPSVLSPAAVVNGQSTEVELKAYLETTGCSTISDYGFEYIKQDEQPTSATGETKVSLKATPISIGKTFRTQVSGLTEGVYWFRAYANNEAGKSGSTSWISFTIITDGPYPTLNCNNNALQILDNGKVKVTVTNIGNEPVLKGSYGLTIIDQGAVLAYSPQQVPAIDANNGTVEFTTVLPINKNNYNVTATLTYKGRTQSCNTKICVPQVGGTPDTIRYTIDAAAVTDKCMLVFPTVYEAIDHLKSSKNGDDRFVDKVGDGYMLRQPVVMEVVYSTTPYRGNVRLTTTGGYEGGEGHLVINITNINNDGNSGNGIYKIDESGNIVDGYNPLIIRAANPNAMPALQHVALRKSRSVTLRNLNIISSDVDKDNAIDIDNNNNSWVGNGIGAFKNARITISNCKIKSKGFTCVHVSAVDKVYFENNEITADLENEDVKDENTRCWGSSVKFIRSTNIKFIRNNFMGTHATSVWLQGVEKVLFMNNVFWNNNKIEEDIFAMFRIVQQSDPEKPKNIGIYYNTLFLADNSDGRSKHPKFNFLTLNSNDKSSKDDPIAHDGNFETSTIEFKYNNCYSYDLETPGKPSNSFKNRDPWSGLCYNNFWSAKSGADFSFNGCGTIYNENVKEIVCTTTATDPNSLVISGDKLNLGNKPTVDAETGNVGTSGIALNSDAELYYDRTRDEARVGVAEGDWTLGAYQQTANVLTEAIIWQGSVSNEWDDRNNWIDARTKNTLTCVNTLSQNLQVIIPAPHSENYPAPDERGIVNYPILPKFDDRDSRFGAELVNAGQGLGGDLTQFAKTINMEYGASLRGVENLGAGNGSHYDETTTGFTAQRDQWILVGTVVKPFDENGNTRNIKSGDYFITGQTPHVYMHYAYMDGNTAKWSEPFTSLEESLEVTDVMAINIPNQYGAGKLTSQAYYTYVKKDPTKINDHLEAKDYSFNGRFVNETALPNYTDLTSGVPTLLNNSYPANIDPKVIEAKNLGTVLMYDYKAGSFCIDPQVDREAVIKPQHGFIFIPAGDALTITSDMVVNGETTSRSAGVEMPILSLDLYNANSINGERSRVVVKLDELKDEGPAPLDVTKIFTDNSTTPELYIVMYDNQYQRIHISNTETIIPLGIRLKKSMNVSFQKFSAEGFDKVTLVDKVLNTEYDLLNTKEVITEELSAGDIEGRFFLNLKETEEDDNIEGDDNVSTEIEEDSAEKCINILVEADNTVKVITNGVELENIYVSDMAGRTVGYKASGYSAVVELPVVQGVYMINVIGDTASRTEKVILK